ncbi:hypothetical protein BC937DRAFT_92118 [Endogone sp. FLAS-F59071]|nr:hypothetical protein BC937DRAFT_92118 [Endogone sp. FLAS-F59071]|eukprot:RUS15697.1 hypothetical protein BC937DRAFT_92118 [Endogone sp. FLAS-F59071]
MCHPRSDHAAVICKAYRTASRKGKADCKNSPSEGLFVLHIGPWLLNCKLDLQNVYTNSNGEPERRSFQCEFATNFKLMLAKAYPTLTYRVLVEVKEANDRKERRQRLDILVLDCS